MKVSAWLSGGLASPGGDACTPHGQRSNILMLLGHFRLCSALRSLGQPYDREIWGRMIRYTLSKGPHIMRDSNDMALQLSLRLASSDNYN